MATSFLLGMTGFMSISQMGSGFVMYNQKSTNLDLLISMNG